jgi:hypothetical protein
MTQYIFEKIVLKKIEINKKEDIYFVFDQEGNIIEVEAKNALEAIVKSKIDNPVMVKNIISMSCSSGILCEKTLQEIIV